jgi:hypothetical protein
MEFSSSKQNIAWFKDRNIEGSLALKPSYQRNPVWMARQKCFLIESVLKGIPIPEVFVQSSTDEHGKSEFAVVDGQQRIRALLQFVGADSDADQLEYDKFTLDKLEVTSKWYGKAFSDLDAADKKKFYGYELAVRYLTSDSEEDMKEMFRRINTFTAALKPQELRNATYGGPFAQLAIKFADDYGDFLTENRIITAAAIRRMTDVEYVAELLIGASHGPQGGQPSIIDDYYRQYEDFEDEFPGERTVKKLFIRIMAQIDAYLPDLKSTRWNNKSDFYSLFVALASLRDVDGGKMPAVADAIRDLGRQVDERVEDEEAVVPKEALDYYRNVIRGANDKGRRAGRHAALLTVIEAAVNA